MGTYKDVVWFFEDEDNDLKELEILNILKRYNIIQERADIYRDFAINLLYYMHETYLGREYIYTEKDILGHYDWCVRKVLEEFEEENIKFKNIKIIREYFFTYYLNEFYLKDEPYEFSEYKKFWDKVFDIRNKKRNLFKLFLEIYEVFDKSLLPKKEENKECISIDN